MRWFGGVFEATILTRGGLLSSVDFGHHLSALFHSRFPLNVGSQSFAGSCKTKRGSSLGSCDRSRWSRGRLQAKSFSVVRKGSTGRLLLGYKLKWTQKLCVGQK
jgi:hypothetical protein